ncbi:Hypothetical predicted protein [Mytilus galloprovincialis]|uniref:Uncharacterized protein n=1 Tax=Mytilus galloprovincialis TaxID=29158 RepID=A0A8B6DRC2_MYTGA|nr:Hypothetical predicted protein [Mytilus galloprovincialis]
MALRNSPSTQSTEFSPFHLLFGREMNLPFDTSVTPKQNLSSDAKLQMEEVLSNLKITQDLATKNMLEKQLKSKERYDRNSKIPQFKDPRDHQLQPNEVVQNQANNADRVDQHDQSDENVPQAQNRENETTDGNDDQVEEDHQFYKSGKTFEVKALTR